MITILLRFNGGSTEEEHDIAHIASSIFSPPCAGFFLPVIKRKKARKSRLLSTCQAVGVPDMFEFFWLKKPALPGGKHNKQGNLSFAQHRLSHTDLATLQGYGAIDISI
ncbi:hypothetical protein ACQPT2_02470 [Erwinia amylovora]